MNILEFAVELEQEGERFYDQQAAEDPTGILRPVARFLADEERRHGEILRRRLKDQPYELPETQVPTDLPGIWTGGDTEDGNRGTLSAQTAFYRMAAQKEAESIRLYEELREQRESNEDKELFAYLVRQERRHLELVEQLAELLRRSDEWVESAEFGIREEY